MLKIRAIGRQMALAITYILDRHLGVSSLCRVGSSRLRSRGLKRAGETKMAAGLIFCDAFIFARAQIYN